MNLIVPIIIIGLIVFRVALFIWRQTGGTSKPISGNGVSILYPLVLYIALITVAGSNLFVTKAGILAFPQLSPALDFAAGILGIICAVPVLITTNYEYRDNFIYQKKSKVFLIVLLGVIVLRLALRSILFNQLSPVNLLFLTFLMATTYMLTWRVGSYLKYLRLARSISETT